MKKTSREELFCLVTRTIAIIDDMLRKNEKIIDAELAERKRKINL